MIGGRLAWCRFHIFNLIYFIQIGYFILEQVAVEVRDPLISVGGFDFEGSVDHIFEANRFAIDPGIGIIEFEHIDSFSHGVDTILDWAWFFLLI